MTTEQVKNFEHLVIQSPTVCYRDLCLSYARRKDFVTVVKPDRAVVASKGDLAVSLVLIALVRHDKIRKVVHTV